MLILIIRLYKKRKEHIVEINDPRLANEDNNDDPRDGQGSAEISEIESMATIDRALSGFADDAKARILNWVNAKHLGQRIDIRSPASTGGAANTNPGSTHDQFSDFAELFSAANPKLMLEKALLVAYWFQTVQGEQNLDSSTMNSELKNLGHGLTNITDAFNSLIKRKPALAMQTQKGSGKRARKKYRLTIEGIRYVERMLTGENEQED